MCSVEKSIVLRIFSVAISIVLKFCVSYFLLGLAIGCRLAFIHKCILFLGLLVSISCIVARISVCFHSIGKLFLELGKSNSPIFYFYVLLFL